MDRWVEAGRDLEDPLRASVAARVVVVGPRLVRVVHDHADAAALIDDLDPIDLPALEFHRFGAEHLAAVLALDTADGVGQIALMIVLRALLVVAAVLRVLPVFRPIGVRAHRQAECGEQSDGERGRGRAGTAHAGGRERKGCSGRSVEEHGSWSGPDRLDSFRASIVEMRR